MSAAPWPLCVLISGAYMTPDMVAALRSWPRSSFELLLDSGAFTAWTQNKTVDLAAYERCLKSLEPLFTPYEAIELDVVGDSVQTWKNFLAMREHGFDYVGPVCTLDADDAHLRRCFEYAEYVFLAGMQLCANKHTRVRWAESLRPQGKRVHWLGISRIEAVARWRPYSIDAATWANSDRFGTYLVHTDTLHLRRMTRKDVSERAPWLRDRLRALGFPASTLRDMRDPKAWTGNYYRPHHSGNAGLCNFINCVSYVAYAYDVWHAFGTRYFFVAVTTHNLRNLRMAYRHAQWCGLFERAVAPIARRAA